MASENHGDQRAAPERKPSKDLRSTTRTPQQGGPPLNDGPGIASQQPLLISALAPSPHSDLSTFQKIGVAGPSSTPLSDFRHALGARYCPSGI